MATNSIDLKLKKECIDALSRGILPKQIYDDIFVPQHDGMSLRSFVRELKRWKKKMLPEPVTLEKGTYPGFRPYNATVQVNKDGDIVQSWVRQNLDDERWDDLIDAIHESTEPKKFRFSVGQSSGEMLEIPLFDMHFPQNDHIDTLAKLIPLIDSRAWDQINIVVGQDMLHNDDMRGRTSSGRPIEKVDIVDAWHMARDFWTNVIEHCFANCSDVRLIYSAGNHDESLSWAFVQMLKDRYPQMFVDDTLDQRKLIHWNKCFIGVTHGYVPKSKNHDLRGQFTIEFPKEFSESSVREVHAGHLHREAEADLYGVMIRRLSRYGQEDQWTKDNGYVGAHKRFMIFEWAPGELRAIHYL